MIETGTFTGKKTLLTPNQHRQSTEGTKHAITHHNRFTALFQGPPRWAGARREFWTLWCKGRLTEADTDHPAGCHSIWTNKRPPLPSAHFFTGQMLFLPPNQQCQSTEGRAHSD